MARKHVGFRLYIYPILICIVSLLFVEILSHKQAAAQVDHFTDPPAILPIEDLMHTLLQLNQFERYEIDSILAAKLPKELLTELDMGTPSVGGEDAEKEEFWTFGVRQLRRTITDPSGVVLTHQIFFLTQEIPSTGCYYLYDVLFATLTDEREQFRSGMAFYGELVTLLLENTGWQFYCRVDVNIADNNDKLTVASALTDPILPKGELRLGVSGAYKIMIQDPLTIYELDYLSLPNNPSW